jgi:hypothetical protein
VAGSEAMLRQRAPRFAALVVGMALVLHGNQIAHSSQALVGIGLLNVVTCLFRERTNNLWPCITCHLTYNLVPVMFQW